MKVAEVGLHLQRLRLKQDELVLLRTREPLDPAVLDHMRTAAKRVPLLRGRFVVLEGSLDVVVLKAKDARADARQLRDHAARLTRAAEDLERSARS